MLVTAYCKEIVIDPHFDKQNLDNSFLQFNEQKGLLLEEESFIRQYSDHFIYNKKDFGTFSISKNHINYQLASEFSDEVKLSIFLNQPMACNSYLNNYLVLHASAFSYGEKAFLILGESGSGKSTLLLNLIPMTTFITEDIAVIDNNLLILPSYPILKIQKENFKSAVVDNFSEITFDSRNRFACKIKNLYFDNKPKKIHGIFHLRKNLESEVNRMNLMEKMSVLYASSFRYFENVKKDYEKLFFKKASKLLDVEYYSFSINSDDKPPESAKKLLNFLDQNF